MVLDAWGVRWEGLAGGSAGDLLGEIAQTVPFERSVASALTRAHAWMWIRRSLDSSTLKDFVARLVNAGYHAPAAELAFMLATDDNPNAPYWPKQCLTEWVNSSAATFYAGGVIAAAGSLFPEAERRSKVAQFVLEWIAVAPSEDIKLLFSEVVTDGTWIESQEFYDVLNAVLTRVPELGLEPLQSIAGVLELFLESKPGFVLDAIEALLERSLALEDFNVQSIIAECLALSFSLRLNPRVDSGRVHSVFERALAADAPAAFEALETLDGETTAIIPLLLAPLPRARR